MKKTIANTTIEIIRGDIASQPDMQAIVNAANAHLLNGGGVAGAIHRAAGPGLEKECKPMGPIRPGEAVISGGHNLPNKYVIHCLGPVYGQDKPEDKLLADCYRNALLLADKKEIESIAFPAISTGIFGYPAEDAAHVALKTIIDTIPNLTNIRTIRVVLFGQDDFEIWKKALAG
ncbi:macro domain-containing protein [Marinilabilia salmonicolor]|jgi:O-acetyl-ADP-ribose deacetylase (regulator of RNase III)|uniref:O-acetyl-ADP-ribose deacetylase (Regulator of RNase III) n=1 Tax=Marinilabilia salmonicolor TaxID=989 RepID=A0A2T0WZC2_9BACT|nr:macro domain-containing protein [Marinilabilia salmonicolor]PRY91995.1 O-acetyl-ADP-ribose deacetylase (regulator of RNase III) [Marinilabilia salmonicolor]RCW26090.1 O-acetyl-ADP-ribose deacetylase (regulator of RNase III) [Marinilabilia salmonicolor]